MESAKELLTRIEANDDKMRRSQQRELRLLQAEDLDTLLMEMLVGLKASYELPYVSVVLCDPDHDIRHLMLAAGAPAENYDGLLMVESLAGMAPHYVALRAPWLGAYTGSDHQMIFPNAGPLASVAMIPLMHRKKLIGSINLGSGDSDRFTHGHAADFLAHLGVIASFCIENVVNRARLLRSGFTDVLTGWNNRRYLQVRLNEELARARRDASNLVCLMLDVDHFKRVNDTWGHAAGDAALRELANRIDSQVRASDVAVRYGGEEFTIILPETRLADAATLANNLRGRLTRKELKNSKTEATYGRITLSIGVAQYRPGEPLAELIQRADEGLYAAKNAGRDCVVTEAELPRRASDRLAG